MMMLIVIFINSMQSSTRQLFHQTIRSEAENKLDVVGLSVTEHVDRIQVIMM